MKVIFTVVLRFLIALAVIAAICSWPFLLLDSPTEYNFFIIGLFLGAFLIIYTVGRLLDFNSSVAVWSSRKKLNWLIWVPLITAFLVFVSTDPGSERILYLFFVPVNIFLLQAAFFYQWSIKRLWKWLTPLPEKEQRPTARCPVCNRGWVMESENRFAIFYRCSRYPKCKNSQRIWRNFFKNISKSKSSA